MNKVWITLGLAFFVAIGLIGYSHATRNKRRHTENTSGEALYQMYCLRCHGAQGVGAPNIANLQTSTIDLDSFVKVLKEGRGAMPAFKSTFRDQEFEPLYRHIKSLKP
jgi:mono/diheme cytochrome c family protein